MKRYAVTLARQKRVKLPADYATSGAACRAFLEEHAPKKVANPGNSAPTFTQGEPEDGAIREAAPSPKPRARRSAKPAPSAAKPASPPNKPKASQ
jgi:DNA topoisomerase-3